MSKYILIQQMKITFFWISNKYFTDLSSSTQSSRLIQWYIPKSKNAEFSGKRISVLSRNELAVTSGAPKGYLRICMQIFKG